MPGPRGDPTVVDPTERAKIESYVGLSLQTVEPEAIKFVVDRSKQAGNTAFKEKRYQDAIQMYSQAIAGDEEDPSLFANRSAAYLALGLYDQALWDAQKSVALNSSWAKAHYRLGSALAALNQWNDAAAAFKQGLTLDPSNADLRRRLDDAESRLQDAIAARNAAAATERRNLVLKLRAARREDQKLCMLNQFKQSMAAPDWELEDLEWRPSWLPRLRLLPMDPSTATRDPKRATLLAYISSLADLSHPKTALRILEDAPRLGAFQSALKKALEERPGAHVLALSSGGGVLPLMAAAAGAARVTAVERSRMLYRMTKQILASNEDSLGPNTVHLVARSLRAVRVAADAGSPVEELQQQAVAESEQHANVHPGGDFELLPRKADVLVTDLLDHTALGMGLLSSIDYAAQHLLVPGAVVLPSRVTVHAVLLELCLGDVNGFDLSPMDSYRWYPGDERVQLAELPHRALSKPFVAHTIDLQARVTAVQKAASTATEMANGATPPIEGAPTGQQASEKAQGGEGGSCWEADLELEVDIVADGRWNAVAFWFELDLGVASAQKLGTGTVAAAADTHDLATSQISNHTLASYVWPGAERGGTATATASAAPTVGKSWGQAVQYLDGTAVKAGTAVALRVRQDAGQIVFTSTPPPSRLRHALVPRWHYDMILDSARNDAYNAAIRRAVAAKRDAGCRQLAVLDMGAGSGLLSMMAARAGADKVFAAELSGHMCDVAEETTIMNGFLGKILVLDRDVRRMDTVPKPDGTAPELPRRVDMAVFEVFDSGLIGEGVLHILAAAQMRLLAPGASLVPASAVVYAQPMQMRVESAAGFDVQQANRWRWRPDYEGVELGKRRQDWKPLAEPMEVFSFDFYDIQRAVAVNEALLDFEITAPGVCNAVAMWFDLHLDEETTLSTCPYVDKGPTWQQAVQWLPEVRVAPGERLAITARHDTYSISYALEPGSNGGEEALTARGSGVPLVDPVWKATFDGMQGINSQLVKACVQNPLEFRVAAMAAIQFAARPHEVGLDAAQAAEFCVKMMG